MHIKKKSIIAFLARLSEGKTGTIYKAIRCYPGENIALKGRLQTIVQSVFLVPRRALHLKCAIEELTSEGYLMRVTHGTAAGRALLHYSPPPLVIEDPQCPQTELDVFPHKSSSITVSH